MRRKCCKHFKKEKKSRAEHKTRKKSEKSPSKLRPGNNNNGFGKEVAPSASVDVAQARLWAPTGQAHEGRQHAETTARRETVESPRDESCICKFDDSFNKNKGKGTEIKHNNVWWQSQGETKGDGRGTWIRRKVRVEWESTHNAWIPSMQHGELLSRLPCQYASPSTHVIIVSVCVCTGIRELLRCEAL